MRRRISAFLIAVLILWVSTPALACLVAPDKLTEAEMECCREMAGHCGEMAKADHSCCPKVPTRLQTEKQTVLAVSEKPVSLPLAITAEAGVLLQEVVVRTPVLPERVPTAESPPGALTPLRI